MSKILTLKTAFHGGLIAYQIQTYRYITRMKRDEALRTSLFFRIYNEGALILIVPILILVVLKPF